MKPLLLPPHLQIEFATVQALWSCSGKTRRVDALLLCWVKYEKQLRRLFSFLVFQHPQITQLTIEEVVADLASNNKLYPETFIRGITELNVMPIHQLVGQRYDSLECELRRIRSYRNKLMHGQITGQSLSSRQIEQDVFHLVDWVATLGVAASFEFGCDGLQRNTFRAAKAATKCAVARYPFSSPNDFKYWLKMLANSS